MRERGRARCWGSTSTEAERKAAPQNNTGGFFRPCAHPLHQDDIVLIDGVKGFGLQAYRLAGDQFQFAQRGGLLIEQSLDHILVGQYHQLLTLELARLTHDLTKYLVAHRFRGFDKAFPLASWTRLA